MPDFSYVKRGDKISIPSAEWHNALVDAVRRELTTKRGYSDRNTAVNAQYKAIRLPIVIVANDDIPQYSIFTISDTDTAGSGSGSSIGTGSGAGDIPVAMEFDPCYPKVYSKKIDGAAPVLIANQGQYIGKDSNFWLPILGDEWPVIVNIDLSDGHPSIGESVGPKPDTYKVSKANSGLIVVSAVDFVNERVWVVKTSAITLTELCLVDDHPGRGIPFDAYLGTWSAASDKWVYTQTTVKAIDWREGTPYPEAGSRGLFQPQPSDTYGTIYECVSFDCSAPAEGCAN